MHYKIEGQHKMGGLIIHPLFAFFFAFDEIKKKSNSYSIVFLVNTIFGNTLFYSDLVTCYHSKAVNYA